MANAGRFSAAPRPISGTARLITGAKPHRALPARNAAFRRGQLYEAFVVAKLEREYGDQFANGLWFHYVDEFRGPRNIQLDGWLLDLSRGIIRIIEIKYAHTARAWDQLNFYQPIVEAALGASPPNGLSRAASSRSHPAAASSSDRLTAPRAGSRFAPFRDSRGGREAAFGCGAASPAAASPLFSFHLIEICQYLDPEEKGKKPMRIAELEQSEEGLFNVMVIRK
jgi:hypothetical protein